jgi:hypothetical protein
MGLHTYEKVELGSRPVPKTKAGKFSIHWRYRYFDWYIPWKNSFTGIQKPMWRWRIILRVKIGGNRLWFFKGGVWKSEAYLFKR